MAADRDEQNARYRAGLCVDCGLVPYSPGRVRCNTCHAAYLLNPLGVNTDA
ncbi:hypothetical protein [Mycobacterium asiaticum]|uniref:hypothetical protein n=1 Tax=Mycobacterium asiaticum TaxID=1790 RepID=UPI000AC7DA16|nr:hypothetical protein [Mycobacterium asiaticum]